MRKKGDVTFDCTRSDSPDYYENVLVNAVKHTPEAKALIDEAEPLADELIDEDWDWMRHASPSERRDEALRNLRRDADYPYMDVDLAVSSDVSKSYAAMALNGDEIKTALLLGLALDGISPDGNGVVFEKSPGDLDVMPFNYIMRVEKPEDAAGCVMVKISQMYEPNDFESVDPVMDDCDSLEQITRALKFYNENGSFLEASGFADIALETASGVDEAEDSHSGRRPIPDEWKDMADESASNNRQIEDIADDEQYGG